ncbi:MAG: MFS transporter [Sedimenticola sp.]
MRDNSGRLVLFFSSIGHFFFHYLAAMYFTIVLSLANDWNQPFHDLIELWTPAFILIGLAALPAGRLADVWNSAGMLVVMFIGMGLACAASSLAQNAWQLLVLLGGIGLFAAIYHPVGISWLVRHSEGDTGKKLAINGVFGGLGAAAAGGITGLLLEFSGWRVAFLVPGVACLLVGMAMLWCVRTGRLGKTHTGVAQHGEKKHQKGGALRAFLIMLLPMFTIGLIYNTTQAAMPKLFEERLVDILDGNMAKIGIMVSAVYVAGAAMQFFGGWLADRFPVKTVYMWCWIFQIPLLILIASSENLLLFGLVVGLVALNTAALPPENILLSRFAPERHHGLAFGIKFVLAFGAGPLGVELIALVRQATGSFELLIYGLGISAAVTSIAVMLLPRDVPIRSSQS